MTSTPNMTFTANLLDNLLSMAKHEAIRIITSAIRGEGQWHRTSSYGENIGVGGQDYVWVVEGDKSYVFEIKEGESPEEMKYWERNLEDISKQPYYDPEKRSVWNDFGAERLCKIADKCLIRDVEGYNVKLYVNDKLKYVHHCSTEQQMNDYKFDMRVGVGDEVRVEKEELTDWRISIEAQKQFEKECKYRDEMVRKKGL